VSALKAMFSAWEYVGSKSVVKNIPRQKMYPKAL